MPETAQRGRTRSRNPFASLQVVNRPARFPDHGVWPFEMRADLAAAFLDFRTTRELMTAVVGGDAPKATAIRGEGRTREPVWHIDNMKDFLAKRHGSAVGGAQVKSLREVIAGHEALNRPR